MKTAEIEIHEVVTDGLPPLNGQSVIQRCAFIFDGCIISGYALELVTDPSKEGYPSIWEADTNVGHKKQMGGITHWVKFPVLIQKLGNLE